MPVSEGVDTSIASRYVAEVMTWTMYYVSVEIKGDNSESTMNFWEELMRKYQYARTVITELGFEEMPAGTYWVQGSVLPIGDIINTVASLLDSIELKYNLCVVAATASKISNNR